MNPLFRVLEVLQQCFRDGLFLQEDESDLVKLIQDDQEDNRLFPELYYFPTQETSEDFIRQYLRRMNRCLHV